MSKIKLYLGGYVHGARKVVLSVVTAIVSFLFVGMPMFASAQSGAITSFQDLGNRILGIINGQIIPLLIALALIFFLYGVFRLIFFGGNEKDLESAKTFIFYGIVGLFVMVSVWGLVNILTGTFFGNSFSIPRLQ